MNNPTKNLTQNQRGNSELNSELKPCPKCGEVPEIGYCCGEFFIFHPSKIVGMCVCSSFAEMHSSKQQEVEAWNRRATDERAE